MTSDSEAQPDTWTCPACGEVWPDIQNKVPGGCLSCVDTLRYLEYEVPGMGMVQNDVSAVVCHNDDCEETVTVDPATLVVEDDEAVAIESKEFDMEVGERTGRTQVEIYCSTACRNDHFFDAGGDSV